MIIYGQAARAAAACPGTEAQTRRCQAEEPGRVGDIRCGRAEGLHGNDHGCGL